MVEKRLFPRSNVRLPVKVKVVDNETKSDITRDIDVYTENISKAGMCLKLPQGWDCLDCNNCLGWMYNLHCKLKNHHSEETNRFLFPSINLKISIPDAKDPRKEPIQLLGSCVWANTENSAQDNSYPVGICLDEPMPKKLSAYLLPP